MCLMHCTGSIGRIFLGREVGGKGVVYQLSNFRNRFKMIGRSGPLGDVDKAEGCEA